MHFLQLMDYALFSGGLDSATLVAALLAQGRAPHLLFVDYGQAARVEERRAVRGLSRSFGLELTTIGVTGLAVGPGEFLGRNALLVRLAVAAGATRGVIHLGIHAGTGYADCSPDFVAAMQQSLDSDLDGCVVLSAPFVTLRKPEVLQLAHELSVPSELTYSCEVAGGPCRTCRSCLDREGDSAG